MFDVAGFFMHGNVNSDREDLTLDQKTFFCDFGKAGERMNVDWSELVLGDTKREEALSDKDGVTVG